MATMLDTPRRAPARPRGRPLQDVTEVVRDPVPRPPPTPPEAGPLRIRRRHGGVLASFLALVAAPLMLLAVYLWGFAEDQFVSRTAFAVRSEDGPDAALAMLGGVADLTGTGAGGEDAEILYDWLRSRALVDRLRDAGVFRGAWASDDPVFGHAGDGTVEDDLAQWRRMTRLAHDPRTGLLDLEVRAFDPDEARRFAAAALAEGTALINRLSAQARADATAHARDELARAEARLSNARAELTAFRSRNRMIDPAADVAGRMGLLASLEQQLAEAMIAEGLLRDTTGPDDPRIQQGARRIAVIRERIAEERATLGAGGAGEDYALLTAEFERLAVEREFAEASYTAAAARLDAAAAEARRTSRYLAAFIEPTLAERAEFPARGPTLALAAAGLTAVWALLVLVWYSLRDRRPA